MSTCNYIDPETGKKCGNKLGVYINYCWKHTDMLQNIQIKKSQIPKSGYGLYAGSKGFKQADKMLMYSTNKNHILEKDLNEKCSKARDFSKCYGDYILCHGKHCWDGRDPKKATVARFSNDCYGSKLKCNAKFEVLKGNPWLVATKDIKPGEEILTSYGIDYWKAKGL